MCMCIIHPPLFSGSNCTSALPITASVFLLCSAHCLSYHHLLLITSNHCYNSHLHLTIHITVFWCMSIFVSAPGSTSPAQLLWLNSHHCLSQRLQPWPPLFSCCARLTPLSCHHLLLMTSNCCYTLPDTNASEHCSSVAAFCSVSLFGSCRLLPMISDLRLKSRLWLRLLSHLTTPAGMSYLLLFN